MPGKIEDYALIGEIDWLPGYENSKPVRVGNAASEQVQLDIYGEMLDSFFHAQHSMNRHTEDDFRVLCLLLRHLEGIWQQPDDGIWETRGGKQQFTYSKMMAWVAFDRAVLLAERLHYQAPIEEWKTLRDAIYAEICARGFNREKNAFVEAYGSDQLDTARVSDGLPPGEGVFLACSFWMVSALLAIGRKRDAQVLFDRLLALRNDLGLLSEEYDPEHNRMVGNFPQAFSHIALVNAAFDLEADGAKVRARSHRVLQPKKRAGNSRGKAPDKLVKHPGARGRKV